MRHRVAVGRGIAALCLFVGCSNEPRESTSVAQAKLDVPGLVAAYSFDEGTGSVLHDLTNNGNDGALSGQTWIVGKYGTGLSFNGNFVTVPDAPSLDLTTAVTLSAWVRPLQPQGWYPTVAFKETVGGLSYALYSGNLGPEPGFCLGGSGESDQCVLAGSVPEDSWTHLAGTFDGSVYHFYIDGDLAGSLVEDMPAGVSAEPLRIGGNIVWDEFFRGVIDELRVYSRALSAAEIRADLETPVNETPDITPPVANISLPAESAAVSGLVDVFIDTSTDLSVASVKFFIDGTLHSEDDWPPFRSIWDVTPVSVGTHVISIEARDTAGNISTDDVSVTVETPPGALVAAYSFDEGTGSVLHDATSNGNDGALSGQAWIAGKYGSGLSFDGNFVTVPDSPSLDLTTAVTLSAWVRPLQPQGWYPTIALKETVGGLSYALYAGNLGPEPGFCLGGSGESDECVLAGSVPENTWTHLAGTFNGSVYRFYINGEVAGALEEDMPAGVSSEPLRIGGNTVWDEFFRGVIDDVRIYSRALTPAEIQTDMVTPVAPSECSGASVDDGNPCTLDACDSASGVTHTPVAARTSCSDGDPCNGDEVCNATGSCEAGTPIVCDLVAAYSFDEGEGVLAADASGNFNTGTLSTQAWSTAGMHGGAVSLGGNDWITIDDSPTLDLTTAMTLEAWVRVAILPYPWMSVFVKEANTTISYGLYAADTSELAGPEGRPGAWILTDFGPNFSFNEDPLPLDEWVHLAATYEGSALKFYVNGVVARTNAWNGLIVPSDGPLHIGGNAVWGEFFIGLIDDVRIYSRALTAAEIQADMVTPVAPSDCSEAIVDDGNPCTIDACDPGSGVTHTPVASGTSCSDDNACNGAEVCNATGTCVSGTPLACAAIDQCHDAGTCTPATGVCSTPNKADGTACTDANACTATDTCQSGTCTAGSPVASDDGNPCTTDSCDPVTGVTHATVAAGTSCADGNACNGAETCNATGSCVAGTPVVCVASDQCHDVGTCNPIDGTCSSPAKANGTVCPDGDVCNGAETCQAGSCALGTPVVVDDGNPCTIDACDSGTGATHTPVASGTSCADGNSCNGVEACNASGTCVSGTPVTCIAVDQCHDAGTCNPATGLCSTPGKADGTECTDANACTASDACQSGTCTAGSPVPTDDGNPCTSDSCDPVTGVTHALVATGTSCADGNECNGAETCNGVGVCIPGSAIAIDDGGPCVTGTCNPLTGVVTYSPSPEGTACFPDACTHGACVAGECASQAPIQADDGDPCTIEWCDPETGPQQKQCSAIDQTAATTVFSSMKWLFEGPNPPQIGVVPGTITAQRATTIGGFVRTRSGAPLPGIRVSIVDHPEYGYTISHADGMFDMVVNGGGTFTLRYEREGYLSAMRTTACEWGDRVGIPDVFLLQADPLATAVDLTVTTGTFQVAQGSVQTDADGTRQATLLVPVGTEATLHASDGSTEILPSMNVRITEFTVGTNGPGAMPAELPPESHYTHAFEIDADEAVDAAATSTTFSVPLLYYVDDYRGFPVGTLVPVGSLDRKTGAWRAEESGVVLKVLSISAGTAQIDITGDGIADAGAPLTSRGIGAPELQQLAQLYPAGKVLQRIRIPHFSAYDCNLGVSCYPNVCPEPDQDPYPDPDPDNECNVAGASSINCQKQVLKESLPVAGTPYSLNYASNRAAAHEASYRVKVPVFRSVVSSNVTFAHVDASLGPRRFSGLDFAPTPNQATDLVWDGKDAYGRTLQGSQRVSISVTYTVLGCYTPPSTWAEPGLICIGAGLPLSIQTTRSWRVPVGPFDATAVGFGGWTLDAHHVYEPQVKRLQLGNGSHLDEVGLPLIINRLSPRAGDPPLPVSPYLLEAAPDGTIYYSDPFVIRRVPPNGTPQAFAGGGVGFGGEGVPSTHPSVQFNQILDLDLGPDGALYIADHNNQIVRKVGSDGIIRTFAGMPGLQGHTGDGGPAIAARINRPQGVVARPDGSVFIATLVGVRRVSPDGRISTVAGNGNFQSEFLPPDGTPATSVRIAPESIALAPDGSIYLGLNTCSLSPCTGGLNRIVRIENGRFYHVAGQGCVDTGPDCTARRAEGIAAKEAAMTPIKLAFDRQGQLYFIDAETSSRLRTIDRNGLVYTVAGARFGTGTTLTNLGPAVGTTLGPRDLTLGPDGSFIVAASPTGASSLDGIFKIMSPLPAESGAAFSVGGSDGRTIHAFDAIGKHLSTRDSLTGATVHGFSYGATGLLSTVTDRASLVTQIERDPTGKATAIISPFGQRTELGIDSNNHLTSVEDPEGNLTTMTYSSGGLLGSVLDPRNRESTMEYDDLGRLSLDSDGNGGSHELSRTEAYLSWTVDRTTALGRTTTYETEFTFGGSGQRSTITNPAGLVSVTSTDPADATVSQHPDGTIVTTTQKPDSRFGMVAPTVSTSTKLPSGLTSVESSTRQYDSLSPSDPLTFVSMTDTLIRNGRSWITTFNRSSRTFTRQSPQGRTSTEILDTNGRTTSTQISTLATTSFFYDTSGRLDHITQGSGALSRTTNHGYVPSGPAAGYLQSVTDALTVPTTYTRDALGRTLTETRASTTTAFSWDPTSNLSSVTPPGKPTHGMNYTPVNLLQTYTPPPSGLPASATSYTYDPDRMLRTETRPDGIQIVRTPDSAGRLDTVAIPGGLIEYDYYPPGLATGSGKTSDILGPYGTDLHFTYDGMLTKSITWSGDVPGSVAWNYDTDFNKILETVSGATGTAQAAFGYDNDQLLTCASPTTCNPPGSDALRLIRSPQHGLITSVTLGSTSETWAYNTFGELARQTATFAPSTPLVDITYDAPGFERDKLGRIVRKTEVIGGVTKVFGYTYDNRRRLTDVTVNGVPEEHFEYDANGNRTLGVNATAGTAYTGNYDDQDRLLTYGPWTFTYTANGELETKTNTTTGDAWLFQYDALGNLMTVGLPNGDLVEYLVDGMGRRVGKKKNGVLLKQWVYRDALKPVAELDGAGALVAEFVYGSKSNVPDYVRRGSTTYRVVSDHLGSTRYVVNVANSAEVPFTASYTSFGVVTGTGLDWMPFGFAGGLYDADSGLARFGRRDLDSTVARWTSKDPLRFRGGRNFYHYVDGDPINYLDPRGEFAAGIAVGVGLAAAFWGWFYWEYFEEPLRDADDSGLPGPSDGPQDAYRHCLASCKVVQDGWGETMAENLGNMWEGNDASPSCTMDHNNNAIGRGLGSGATPCETACLNAPLQNSP